MRQLIYVIAILLPSTIVAQKPHSVGIVHKREKYYLTKTCYDILEWEEVALKNQKIQHKVNAVIRKAVRSYKEKDASLLCNKEIDYSAIRRFKVVYAQKGIVSYHLESDVYYKGILHNFHSFNTLNFNVETGEQIVLDSIIDPVQYSNLYNLIITKIPEETAIDSDFLYLKLKGELGQNFLVTNGGIKILFLFRNYPMDVTLTFKELTPYANKSGLLQRLTDAKNHTKM